MVLVSIFNSDSRLLRFTQMHTHTHTHTYIQLYSDLLNQMKMYTLSWLWIIIIIIIRPPLNERGCYLKWNVAATWSIWWRNHHNNNTSLSYTNSSDTNIYLYSEEGVHASPFRTFSYKKDKPLTGTSRGLPLDAVTTSTVTAWSWQRRELRSASCYCCCCCCRRRR